MGFVMITVDDTTTQSYWLNGLIIDKNEQGKGYGKETINSAIRYIKENYSQSVCVNLTVCVDNVAARKLYEKLGFCETRVVYEDEIVYRFTF
ncbi:acetyltransferase, ribosomal protein N-acetylase [Paenibacillus sp. NAIST15-1]|nr:acetyltransferase, ribosomal protein N-acetylase [Paenibacillus sp. NAIST15-1]